ncbi:hypothetical protein SCAB_79731 [Streptomyces scabiei 87.22]|uniref:Uncharacterized protein n=1 Tax=Streptomyces scabiei (strain 87.22) TaxID=680198 RepID=C9ZFX2_STRSW|nr:hypothetical protein SCAB_79731 [Streptomyces scabiei 87.22]
MSFEGCGGKRLVADRYSPADPVFRARRHEEADLIGTLLRDPVGVRR